MFVVPNKYGAIRTVENMREMNKNVICRKYPLPKIQDVFNHQQECDFMPLLDLTLLCYTWNMEEQSTCYYIIVTNFVKFIYLRLTLGMPQIPGWAQEDLEIFMTLLLKHKIDLFMMFEPFIPREKMISGRFISI